MESADLRPLRWVALLRITLGVILLATWWENLEKGLYTPEGLLGLFTYLFEVNGGGPGWYRALVWAALETAPGLVAAGLLAAELLMGLGLLLGAGTRVAGSAATLFFANLLLANLGGSEWIWTYVLLTVAALVAAATRSGRVLGVDAWLGPRPQGAPLW